MKLRAGIRNDFGIHWEEAQLNFKIISKEKQSETLMTLKECRKVKVSLRGVRNFLGQSAKFRNVTGISKKSGGTHSSSS